MNTWFFPLNFRVKALYFLLSGRDDKRGAWHPVKSKGHKPVGVVHLNLAFTSFRQRLLKLDQEMQPVVWAKLAEGIKKSCYPKAKFAGDMPLFLICRVVNVHKAIGISLTHHKPDPVNVA